MCHFVILSTEEAIFISILADKLTVWFCAEKQSVSNVWFRYSLFFFPVNDKKCIFGLSVFSDSVVLYTKAREGFS